MLNRSKVYELFLDRNMFEGGNLFHLRLFFCSICVFLSTLEVFGEQVGLSVGVLKTVWVH